MIRVVVESPFAASTPEGVERHLCYLRACMSDCLRRGEAPFASHAIYTQPGVLNDRNPHDRNLGIEAGLVWGAACDLVAVYYDLGVSRGMTRGIDRHRDNGKPIQYRKLGGDW